MFNKIGCERSSVDEMLGAQEGVTDQNLLQYLGIIEDRTNQLLLAKSYVLKEKVFCFEYLFENNFFWF